MNFIKRYLFNTKQGVILTRGEAEFLLIVQTFNVFVVLMNLLFIVWFAYLRLDGVLIYHIFSTLFTLIFIHLNKSGWLKSTFFIGFVENLVRVSLLSYYLGDTGIENALLFVGFVTLYAQIFSKWLSYLLFGIVVVVYGALNSYFWLSSYERVLDLPQHFNMVIIVLAMGSMATMGFLKYLFHQSYEKNRDYMQTCNHLMTNLLPYHIAQKMSEQKDVKSNHFIYDSNNEVTILFIDILGTDEYVKYSSTDQITDTLHTIFVAFDKLCLAFGVEKIKTLGHRYLIMGGLQAQNSTYIKDTLDLAIALKNKISDINAKNHTTFSLRIGIHIGTVLGGVIGHKKISYEPFGYDVHIAGKIESYGINQHIQVSKDFYKYIDHTVYAFQKGVKINIKDIGYVETYILTKAPNYSLKG